MKRREIPVLSATVLHRSEEGEGPLCEVVSGMSPAQSGALDATLRPVSSFGVAWLGGRGHFTGNAPAAIPISRILLTAILLVGCLSGLQARVTSGLDTHDIYADRLAALLESDRGKPLTNHMGQIVWGRSYILDSLVDAYQATGNNSHLDHFVELADRVMMARADRAGELDYRGRQTHGWITSGHFSFGVPAILPDDKGNPSLEITTIYFAYNNLTEISLSPGSSPGTFRIDVKSTRYDPPKVVTFDELTMENVEESVNPEPGERAFVRVRRLGDEIPAPVDSFTPETSPVVLHNHHTGRIATPIARFCDVVLSDPGLDAYHEKANDYLAALRITMAEHDQYFRESYDGTRGWTVYERGAPFPFDGFPSPHNVLAHSGTAYLAMYRATDEPYFRERATQLARLFHDHHLMQANDTWMLHYWWGQVHEGWEPDDEVSRNLPRREGRKAAEDLAHLQGTLNFLVDCHRHGIVFTREDLERWALTAMEVLLEEDGEGFHFRPFLAETESPETAHHPVRDYTDGFPRLWHNQVIYGLISVSAAIGHRELLDRCKTILQEHYQETASGAGLLSWSRLLLAEKEVGQ